MRKLLLFSSVCVLSSVVFISPKSFAERAPDLSFAAQPHSASGGGINVADKGLQKGIENLNKGLKFYLETLGEDIIFNQTADSSKQTEALQTTAGMGMANEAAIATAQDTNRALTSQGAAKAQAEIEVQGVDDIACPGITSSMSYGSAEDNARKTAETEVAKWMNTLTSDSGQVSEFGRRDMNRKLFDMAMQFCKPTSHGGTSVGCSGTDNEHLSIGTLLFRPNVGLGLPTSPDDPDQLEYLQNLLYGQVPDFLQADLLQDPSTEVRELFVERDRLIAELGIGQAAFSQVIAERSPTPNAGRAIPYIAELLTEGNFLSPEQVTALFPDNRASVRAQLDAITLGMMNPNFLQQQLVNNPNAMGINISYNTALTNRLLYKMLGELEFIKLAIATDISSSRYDEAVELNSRINAANSKQ